MKYKLGEVVTEELLRGTARFICTGVYPAGPARQLGFCVLTPIPEADDETGLGRRYFASEVVLENLEPDERLYEWR